MLPGDRESAFTLAKVSEIGLKRCSVYEEYECLAEAPTARLPRAFIEIDISGVFLLVGSAPY